MPLRSRLGIVRLHCRYRVGPLGLDDALQPAVVTAEAPHDPAPALMGKDIANLMAMVLTCSAVLDYAGRAGDAGAEAAAVTIR